jgi:hypothetical protein
VKLVALRASVTCLLVLVPVVLAAQSIDGTADWGYGQSTFRTGDAQTATSAFMQGYTLGYRSSFWDPRFLTYAGELTFNKNALTFGQDDSVSKQTGFKLAANLFPTRPFRASIHGSRQVGGESANYPESSAMRGGLALPAGSTPELRTERSEFGVSWQLTGKSMPRVELSFQEGSATIAAGSLAAVQQQTSIQALVAREGPRVSNTLRYQRTAFDNDVSQAFRQRYSDLDYEFVARASDRTWGTVRAGRRSTFSLFDVPAQFTDIGVASYHPPPGGEIDLLYGTATLTHQVNEGLSADVSVGYDREHSAVGGTSALLATATTQYRPLTGVTLHAGGTYGDRGQQSAGTQFVVLTRGVTTGAEYSLLLRLARASAAYEVGHGWNTSELGLNGESRLWRARADAGTGVLRIVQLNVGYDQSRSVDDLLPFGNQWQERTHASARSTLTPRITLDAGYDTASIERGVAPLLFRTHYRQATGAVSFVLTPRRQLSLTSGRFFNRSFAADDSNQYVGLAFNGTLIGPLHLMLTVRRERTLSTVSQLAQDGYYTIGTLDYRLRLFTFSLEHRYTDLALAYATRLEPLAFTGNQILFRVTRRFGVVR